MFRKNLIPILLTRPMTLREIARVADQPVSDTESDLEHLLKSLKHGEYVAEIQPAYCRKCGFGFNPEKIHKPSKCPKCHGTWLSEPRIQISRKAEPSLAPDASSPKG